MSPMRKGKLGLDVVRNGGRGQAHRTRRRGEAPAGGGEVAEHAAAEFSG